MSCAAPITTTVRATASQAKPQGRRQRANSIGGKLGFELATDGMSFGNMNFPAPSPRPGKMNDPTKMDSAIADYKYSFVGVSTLCTYSCSIELLLCAGHDPAISTPGWNPSTRCWLPSQSKKRKLECLTQSRLLRCHRKHVRIKRRSLVFLANCLGTRSAKSSASCQHSRYFFAYKRPAFSVPHKMTWVSGLAC